MKYGRQVLLGRPGQVPATPATLSAADDGFVFHPENWVEEPQQVKRRKINGNVIFDLFERRGVVADFEPRPLWGLEDGRPFTVLDAKMSVQSKFMGLPAQVYKASSILWDIHIHGPDSLAEAVRLTFSMTRGAWATDEPITLPEGQLSSWSHENRPGLTWEPSTNHTVKNLTQRFPTLLTALFRLWTASSIGVSTVHLRIPEKGWCPLEFIYDSSPVSSRSFVPLHELNMEVVAAWLSKAKKLGPIPFVASEDRGVLQVDAQMLATALEGLHRRLVRDADRSDPTAGSKIEQSKRRTTYADRLSDMLPRVFTVAPGLLGPSLEDWISDTKELRNILSHWLLEDDDFGEEEISRYYVLSVSIRWALRILLLLEIADDEGLIRSALQNSDDFMYALANIDREKYWKDFSAYETFLCRAANN